MKHGWPCGQNMILRIDCTSVSYFNHIWAPWPFTCVPSVTSDSCSCSLWKLCLGKEKRIKSCVLHLDFYETAGDSTFSGSQRNHSRHRFVFCAFVDSLFAVLVLVQFCLIARETFIWTSELMHERLAAGEQQSKLPDWFCSLVKELNLLLKALENSN